MATDAKVKIKTVLHGIIIVPFLKIMYKKTLFISNKTSIFSRTAFSYSV
jgi:hypothetical protein